jgi:hypothetical protein
MAEKQITFESSGNKNKTRQFMYYSALLKGSAFSVLFADHCSAHRQALKYESDGVSAYDEPVTY